MRILFLKAFALADAGLYNRKKGATIGNKCYGYIRVSSKDQNEECQLIALHEKGVENDLIYIDKRFQSSAISPDLTALRCIGIFCIGSLTNGSIQFILKKERERLISRSYHKVIFLRLIVFTEIFSQSQVRVIVINNFDTFC